MYRSVQFPDISYYYVVKWIGTFWYKKLKKKLSIKVEKKSDAVCADWLESSTLLFLVAFTFLDQYFGRWYHTHTYIHTHAGSSCGRRRRSRKLPDFSLLPSKGFVCCCLVSSWKFKKDLPPFPPQFYGLIKGAKRDLHFLRCT